jgi:AcrR family transcriptional regulator
MDWNGDLGVSGSVCGLHVGLDRYGDAVPPPPAARDKVLDAFERLLIEHGERETTLDAVARAAGVSKGGLIYHFGSREALIEGLLARLEVLADEDVALMNAAPEGPVAYYIRTSAYADAPIDRTLVAATRLLQRSHSRTREVLAAVHDRWYQSLLAAVGDPATARLIMLVGYGMYYNATIAGADPGAPTPAGEDDEVLRLLQELVRSHSPGEA